MELAWQTGFPHADHLLATLDARQMGEILAFARTQPLGWRRMELMLARLCQAVAMGAGASGATVADYLPDWEPAPGPQTPAEMDRAMRRANAGARES